LSNAIKQMEKLLGAELLTRSTHRLELTPVGAEVLARTDFLVNTFEVALRDIESTVQRGRAFVRIGVIPSASARVAAAASEFLQSGQREVELAWRDAPSNTLLAELRSGQIDMAVAAITEPPGGLTCIDLFRDPLVLVVRRDHALAAAGDANWEAIGKERQHARAGQPGARAVRAGPGAVPRELFRNALCAGAQRTGAGADAAPVHLVAARP
jgi:DNA-binding transcriptional LysR family regulator